MKYHIGLSSSSPVSEITNDLFSDNLFPLIRECSDSGSIRLNNGLPTSVTDTISQYEDRLVVREIINNNQNNIVKGFIIV